MKRISHRMIFLILLMSALVLGLGIFTVRYTISADEWVVFPGSPHVYSGSNLSVGQISDRNGILLLDADDERIYAQDPEIRSATMHLLGDRFGYIQTNLLDGFRDELVGFDRINGLYNPAGEISSAMLTVDANLQKTALQALQGRKGTIGVYNYRTGEILCAVTSPTYDPDHMPDVEQDVTGAYDGVYLNRFFQTTYVPGSIFKVITAAAALETLEDAETMTFECTGSCEIGGDTIVCNGYHGTVTLEQALGHSCNVAFGQLAVRLGAETLETYASRFGITGALTFDGLTTAAGSFNLEGAAESEVAWSGIGQYTDLINACQYLTAMGAIANGGAAARPCLMKEVDGGLLTGYTAKPQMLEPMIDADAAEALARMMHQAVLERYGAWQFPDLYVCAKSGTAELGPNTTPHATFAGFIQDKDYPLAFIVIVEHGGSGSAACAPIAGQVLHACVEVLKAEQ